MVWNRIKKFLRFITTVVIFVITYFLIGWMGYGEIFASGSFSETDFGGAVITSTWGITSSSIAVNAIQVVRNINTCWIKSDGSANCDCGGTLVSTGGTFDSIGSDRGSSNIFFGESTTGRSVYMPAYCSSSSVFVSANSNTLYAGKWWQNYWYVDKTTGQPLGATLLNPPYKVVSYWSTTSIGCAISYSGALDCFGWPSPTTTTGVKDISIEGWNTYAWNTNAGCELLNDGTVQCFWMTYLTSYPYTHFSLVSPSSKYVSLTEKPGCWVRYDGNAVCWDLQNWIESVVFTGALVNVPSTNTVPNNGGVSSFVYDGSGNVCQTGSYVTESGTYVSDGFGSLSGAVDFTGSVVTDTTNATVIGNFYSSGGSNWDQFSAVGVDVDSLFWVTSLSYSGFAGLSTGIDSAAAVSSSITNLYGVVDPSNYPTRLSFRSSRWGKASKIDYVKFSVDPSVEVGTKLADVVFMNGQYKDTEPLRVTSTGIALATAQPQFEANGTLTVNAFGILRFTGFEMGTRTGNVDQRQTCSNQYWDCRISYGGVESGYSCYSVWHSGGLKGTCGFVDNVCKPNMDPSAAQPVNPDQSGTGALGMEGSGSNPSGIGNSSTITIGPLPSVSTGADCSQMFSGATFLYKWGNSVLLFSFSGAAVLSDQRWSCSFLGADVCGTAYDATSFLLGKFADTLNFTVGTVMKPLSSAVAYMGTPEPGKHYCFFGSNWVYVGKPPTYKDYADGWVTVSTSGNTGFDYFVIGASVISLVYMVFP